KIIIIFKKEFFSFFKDPLLYVAISFYGFFLSYSFVRSLLGFEQKSLGQMDIQKGAFFHEVVLSQITMTHLLLLFMIPFLAVRLFSQDRLNGAIVVYFISPTPIYQLVLAKTMTAIVFVFLFLLFSMIYPLLCVFLVKVNLSLLFISYTGLFFVVSIYACMSLLMAILIESTLYAGFMSLLIIIVSLLYGDIVSTLEPGFIRDVFSQFSLSMHFQSMVHGAIYLSSLTYFISGILFLFLLNIIFANISLWKSR
ncbi:MAG: hypothetical protein KDD50_16405, partial [Bdellovibrionales bacterium]|nr:hypothetical protein [Bdellovibrionales bacterium]